MKARDVLRSFTRTTIDADDAHEGIFSDVFGTLIVHGALDQQYYRFLLWARDQNIPITIMSSEMARARDALRALGCDERLVESLQDKMHLLRHCDKPLEAVIDDSIFLDDALIYINPETTMFRDFLATCQYRNHGRSHPAGLQHRPAP